MIKNRQLKDFIYVFGANSISFIASIFTGFFIPKFLPIEEFGYWQLFAFYLAYVGIFQFGFNDGIYIRYGNYDYDQLPKERFRAYFKFLIIFQLIVSVILILVSMIFVTDYIRKDIFIFIGINTIIVGTSAFFTFISQVTRNFKVFSLYTILSKIIYVILAMILLSLNVKNHIYLIYIVTLTNFLILLLYVYNLRDVVFGKSDRLKDSYSDIISNFTIGFFVMIGNFMSMLITGTGRVVLDLFFNIKDFAMYAFSVSLLLIINVVLIAISTVIYPYLARASKEYFCSLYERMEKIMLIVLSISLSGYFIIEFIVIKFLPKYNEALHISLILFASILFSGKINAVPENFYKVLKLQKDYTINNIVACIISITTAMLFYFIFRTPIAIAWSTLLSFYLWLLYSDYFFMKKIKIKFLKIHIVQLIIVSVFIIYGYTLKWYVGLICYPISCAFILYLFYKKDLLLIAKEKLYYLKSCK